MTGVIPTGDKEDRRTTATLEVHSLSPSPPRCLTLSCIDASASQRAPGGAGQPALPAPVPAQRCLAPLLAAATGRTRTRAREVCRGWRFFLEDASFWTHVDLSASCGVNPCFLLDSRLALPLLGAACERAKGSLLSVDLSGVVVQWHAVPFVLRCFVLFAVSAANKASLRDLVAPTFHRLDLDEVNELCLALPLCRVRCGVRCTAVEALPLLRREPPFALLTSREHFVANDGGDQALLDMTSALSVHKGMAKLTIVHAPLATRAVVGALVDAAISVGIIDVSFHECGLSQTALPALTRLLQSHGFDCLRVRNQNVALFEGPGLPAFCDALRNCKSLQTLELLEVNLWADTAVAPPIIAALEGLPAL